MYQQKIVVTNLLYKLILSMGFACGLSLSMLAAEVAGQTAQAADENTSAEAPSHLTGYTERGERLNRSLQVNWVDALGSRFWLANRPSTTTQVGHVLIVAKPGSGIDDGSSADMFAQRLPEYGWQTSLLNAAVVGEDLALVVDAALGAATGPKQLIFAEGSACLALVGNQVLNRINGLMCLDVPVDGHLQPINTNSVAPIAGQPADQGATPNPAETDKQLVTPANEPVGAGSFGNKAMRDSLGKLSSVESPLLLLQQQPLSWPMQMPLGSGVELHLLPLSAERFVSVAGVGPSASVLLRKVRGWLKRRMTTS